jgi:transcriptional regulator with XRE-family HTH domain
MNLGKDYGRLIRTDRVRAGLSLRDAARICNMTDVEYAEVERGLRSLPVEAERELYDSMATLRRQMQEGG